MIFFDTKPFFVYFYAMKKQEKRSTAKSPDTAGKRKKAESPREAALETLHHREERYLTILESIQEGYFEVDLAGNFTFFNNTVCRVLGYPKEELIGMNNRQYTDKEELKRVFEAYNEVYKTGKPNREFGQRIIRKDGAKIYIEGSISLLKNSSDKPIGFRGIVRDVTERNKFEESLKRSEEKYRLLADNITEHVWLLDLNIMKAVYLSPSVEKMYGYTFDEMKNRSLREIVTEESFQKMADSFFIEKAKALAIPPPYIHKFSLELEVRHKDGHLLWVDNTLSFIRDENGKPAFILGETRDITERKQAEERLKNSEEKFRMLAESSSFAIMMHQGDHWIYANRAAEEISGYTEAELCGMHFWDIVHPDYRDMIKERGHNRQQGKEMPHDYEFKIIAKNGAEKWVSLTGNPIKYEDKPTALISVTDITERKNAEENIRENERQYRLLTEKMSDIVWIADMNLRTTYISPSVKNILGFSQEERMHQKLNEQLTPHSLTLVLEALSRELALEEQGTADPDRTLKMELEYYHKDGSTRWMELVISGLRNDQGVLTRIHGVSRDITKRKMAEEKLKQTLESLRKAVGTTIQVLVSAVESRDSYTAGHQSRSADLACAIATEMGLAREKIEGILMAGIIHDIGKLSIPAEILSKPTKLTEIEFSLIKEHARSGYEMLKDVESPWPLAEIVYQHHERMNGSGYPRNLKGDKILMESRILAVADVVEAMASHRPYRPTLGIKAALEEIEKNRGILYDNAVADACLKLFREKGYQLK
jgi:PAS domain S-box-containing protein